MIQTFGQVLGNAVGVALSPVPVIALILMLLSPTGRRNGVAFVAGWLAGVLAVGAVVLVVGPEGSDDGPTTVGTVVQLVVGAAFLALAVRQWRSRPRAGTEPVMPSWMAAVDSSTPLRAAGLAALLASVNPKNLGLTVAAGTSITGSDLDAGGQAVVLLLYALVASTSVLAPVGYLLLGGEGTAAVLDETRGWLVAHADVVMTVLFLVLGAKVLGEGLAALR